MEDREIIALFYARSEDAIQALDTKYGALCHSLAYNIVNDRRDAEECVNDAYLGAWNAIPPAKPDPLATYLCKIVRNLALKRYWSNASAKRGGGFAVAMEELEPCLAAPDTAETQLEARELARMMERFLDTLTPRNRVIFLRRYWFGDSGRDIAERVGLSEKAVSVRLTRLRRRLKQYLTEQEVFV
ncbi:MAG: sigma-70 family RNA polymerase sigma factor [Clostridiales bacterium]|nr:sigma-70 family RNA polymerase sigma factor [Clostridiales bacterium]